MSENQILLKDLLILVGTVFVWRGVWIVLDDVEDQYGISTLPIWRGLISATIGLILLWIVLRHRNKLDGIL